MNPHEINSHAPEACASAIPPLPHKIKIILSRKKCKSNLTKRSPPARTGGIGVKMKSVRVVCWYAFIIAGKCEKKLTNQTEF